MKIYFADTIQREILGYGEKLKPINNLESYYMIITKKPRMDEWWCLKMIRGRNVSDDKK